MIRSFILQSDSKRFAWLLFLAFGSVAALSLGFLVRPHPMAVPDLPGLPFSALAQWDAGWYGEIATNGYWISEGNQSPVAYFPLYPLAIRGLTALGLNRWAAAAILTFVSGIAALWLAHRLLTKLAQPQAITAWLLLISSPYACYLYGIVYSDALFLLLVVGAFLALESDLPLVATLLGALATACRPVAPAVVVGLVVRSIERKRRAGLPLKWVDFTPALAAAGLGAYMLFLQTRFGDPLAFAHVQGAPGWEQAPGLATWFKLEWFHHMWVDHWTVKVRLGAHALLTVAALAALPSVFRRVGVGYGVYCLLVLALPAVSSKDFQGMGRYAIAAFPVLVPLARWLDAYAGLRDFLLLLLPVGLAVAAALFGTGAYLA